jgi:hypothetical protein
LKAGGVGVSSTPGPNEQRDRNAEGVSVGDRPDVAACNVIATSNVRACSHGDPFFGVVVVWSHDRGTRRNAATPGCQRESLRDWGVARVGACIHAEGVFV